MSDKLFEKIVVKPSVDLIPDEYEIKDKIAVHAFTSSSQEDKDSAKLFLETLRGLDYEVDVEKNTHCLDSENIDDFLESINREAKDVSGLILFFSYLCKEDGVIYISDGNGTKNMRIQDFVKKFTSYSCTELKNKPKVFFFHVTSSSQIKTDSVLYGHSYDLTYETPGEADMLVVYKKTENFSSLDFTRKLCDNIKEHGNNEDVYSLVTSVECARGDPRPLVISTLTRKFYLTPSDHRGHHYHIRQHHDETTKNLEEIHNRVSKINAKRNVSSKSNQPRSGTGSRNAILEKPSSRLVSLVVSDGGTPNRSPLGSRKTIYTQKSTGKLASTVESDGGSSNKKVIGNRSPNVRRTVDMPMSLIESDGCSSNRTAAGGTSTPRSRMSSTKSDANLSSRNSTPIDNKPKWRY